MSNKSGNPPYTYPPAMAVYCLVGIITSFHVVSSELLLSIKEQPPDWIARLSYCNTKLHSHIPDVTEDKVVNKLTSNWKYITEKIWSVQPFHPICSLGSPIAKKTSNELLRALINTEIKVLRDFLEQLVWINSLSLSAYDGLLEIFLLILPVYNDIIQIKKNFFLMDDKKFLFI